MEAADPDLTSLIVSSITAFQILVSTKLLKDGLPLDSNYLLHIFKALLGPSRSSIKSSPQSHQKPNQSKTKKSQNVSIRS